MTTYKDTDLREALRRKYANTPQLPSDFMNRMHKVAQPKKPQRASTPLHYGRLGSLEQPLNVAAAPQRGANPHSRRRAGWGWVSIAAALLIAFLVLKPLSNSPRGEEDSLSSERKKDNIDLPTLPPTGGTGRGAEKQIAVLAKVTPTPQPMRKHRKAARRQNSPIEKPTLAQAEPIIPAEFASLPHVEVQSFHEARVSSMDAENDEVDPKMLLYTAEIEMEKTTHKRQAAYEKELMQHGLELLLYLLTEKEEKQADGTVKTQKS